MIGAALRPSFPRRLAPAAGALRSARVLPRGWRDLVFQVALMGSFAVAYEAARILVRGDRPTAMSHAHSIVHAEQTLGVFVELDVQRWALRSPFHAIDIANWTYFNCQFTISFGVLIWVYLRRHHAYARLRNTLLLIDAIGLVGYTAFPAAPPRMLSGLGFADTLDSTGVNHHSAAISALSNPYAAMPSLHTAYAVTIGTACVLLVRTRVLRALWALYPALVVFSIVATGNHFVLDAAGGATVAAVSAGTLLAARRVPPRAVAVAAAIATVVAFGWWQTGRAVADHLQALGPAAPALLVVALLANVLSVTLKATVWKLTLEAVPGVGRVRHRTLVPPLFIGYLCNSVLLLRVGDVVRVADARRRLRADGHPMTTTVALGSAIAEQLVLGAALVALGAGLALTAVPTPRWILLTLLAAAAMLALATLLGVHAHRRTPDGDGRVARLVRAALETLGNSRHILHDRRRLALALAAALASWGCQIVSIDVLLRAFGLPHSVGADMAVFLASTCVGLVPLIPGNVGVFPVAIGAALTPAGVTMADGAAFGLALQALEVGLAAGIGGICAVTSGLALRDLVRRRQPELRAVPGGTAVVEEAQETGAARRAA